MPAVLFIQPLEALLQGAGLEWLIPVINILLCFLLAGIAVRVTRGLLASIARRHMARSTDKDSASRRLETALSILGGVAKYVFYFIAIAISIGELGLSGAMTSMLAAAGIGTLALGIGAQSLIGDIVTGCFMLFEDELAVGDYVKVADVEGIVEEVTLRTVTIRGYKGEKNIIPNGQIKTVVNYSRSDYLAVVELEISNQADAERALDIMLEEMQRVYAGLEDTAAKPPQKIGIVAVSPGSVTLRVAMAADIMQQWHIQREVIRLTRRRFAAEGIAAPHERVQLIDTDKERA